MFDHSKENKDFQCDLCSKTFRKSSTYKNHNKQVHNFIHPKDNERGRPVKTEVK